MSSDKSDRTESGSNEIRNESSNVIPFPVQPSGSEKTSGRSVSSSGSPFGINSLFAKATYKIGAVLFTALLINIVVVQNETNIIGHSNLASNMGGQYRGIASTQQTRSPSWEYSMIDKINKSHPHRSISSVGREVSLEEKMRYGYFSSQYSVFFVEGKVTEINFSGNLEASNRPRYVNDRVHFLREYRDLFLAKFSTIKKQTQRKEGKFQFEVYSLLGKQQQYLASIEFQFDQFGRFISLKYLKI